MDIKRDAFAEIIETAPQFFIAQCWQWNQVPAFGSIVSVMHKREKIIGIVYQTQTSSLDPMRAQNTYQKSEPELHREYPHIFEFLRTVCYVLPLCIMTESSMNYLRPGWGIPLHSFLTLALEDDVRRFFASVDYVQSIVAAGSIIGNLEDVMLALIQAQKTLGLLNETGMTKLLCQYARMTQNSYAQTCLFASRVEQLF